MKKKHVRKVSKTLQYPKDQSETQSKSSLKLLQNQQLSKCLNQFKVSPNRFTKDKFEAMSKNDPTSANTASKIQLKKQVNSVHNYSKPNLKWSKAKPKWIWNWCQTPSNQSAKNHFKPRSKEPNHLKSVYTTQKLVKAQSKYQSSSIYQLK